MSYEKYGLSKVAAGSANHKKGVIAGPDGNYYQIDGFKSKGEDEGGIDQNDGAVFSSSLEADAGVDYTNFNTPQDVENALRELGSPKSEGKVTPEKYEPSEKIKQAKERVEKFEENDYDIYKTDTSDGDSTAQNYLEDYKLNLRDKAAKGELGSVK